MIKLLALLVLFFSVIVHEVAHGITALKLGDDTALRAGRLTLNPIPHIDPFGTIILPLLLTVFNSGFLWAWAKPVPVNPFNFVQPRKDMAKVGAAGPISNIILATIATGLLALLNRTGVYSTLPVIVALADYAILINILLAIVNLVPIPPLDGSRILSALLPVEKAYKYERISRLGPFFALVFLLLLWHAILEPVVWAIYGVFISLT